MSLTDIIIEKIEHDGPISFRDFMELSLYYPELGYYTSSQDAIGVNGDYYTSTNLTAAFGAMIARQLEEMWYHINPEFFTIVEYGAGNGYLCHDILDYLKSNSVLYGNMQYCIIEKSPQMRSREQAHLHDKVQWIDSIEEIAGFDGCVLSNELLDNFAVHHVVMDEELMEVFVTYDGAFKEVQQPARKELKEYFAELGVLFCKGFHTEANLQAIDWLKEIADNMNKGYILTIDYGYPSSELYQYYRRCGTLMCYQRHHINDDPYHDIGGQDITAHVNFSALHHWGKKSGLSLCGFTDQQRFLLSLGIERYLDALMRRDRDTTKNRMVKQLLLQDMGSRYKVLIQQKGLPNKMLRGLLYT